MLKSFHVKNFKQFKDLTLDLSRVRDYRFGEDLICHAPQGDLVKTAVVFGRNASGKSNLGLAIMDVTFHLSDSKVGMDKYDFYLNADSESKVATFCYHFFLNGEDIIYEYDKESVDKVVREVITVGNQIVIERNGKEVNFSPENADKYGIQSLQWDSFKEQPLSVLKFITRNVPLAKNNPLRQLMNFATHMLLFTRVDFGNAFISPAFKVEKLHDYICRNNLIDDFQKFLKNAAVNEEIVEKTNDQGERLLYFKHKKDIPMVSVASSGTQALLLQFYWLNEISRKTSKASFVFVDEYDAFYHYELAERIYTQMRERCPVQCILTTHNTNLMSNKNGRPDTFLIITPDRVRSMADLTQREIRVGNNLEKLYMANEFNVK